MSGIYVSDTRMLAETSGHRAQQVTLDSGQAVWRVSWLAGRDLTRDEAISALTISNLLHAGALADLDVVERVLVISLAEEIGLTDASAARLLAGSPPLPFDPGWLSPVTGGIPTGPIGEAPWSAIDAPHGGLTEAKRAALTEVLAGVELGSYDRLVVDWMAATCDLPTVATVCSWLLRVRRAGAEEAGIGRAHV